MQIGGVCSAAGVVGAWSSAHHEQGRFPLLSPSSTLWTHLHCHQVTRQVSGIFHSHLLDDTYFPQAPSGSSRQGWIGASRCLPRIISFFLSLISDYHGWLHLLYSWDGSCVCVGRGVDIHTCTSDNAGRCKREHTFFLKSIDVLLVRVAIIPKISFNWVIILVLKKFLTCSMFE